VVKHGNNVGNGHSKNSHLWNSSNCSRYWCFRGWSYKQAEVTELRTIVREELKKVLWEAWPEKTGPVKGLKKPEPNKDYRQVTPPR
jgi:hypothetical protein